MLHPVSVVTYNRKYKAIQYRGKSLQGITKVLKQCFYPHYTYYKAKINHGKQDKEEEEEEEKKYKHIKGSARLGRGFDTAAGKVVRLIKKYPFLCCLDFFLDPKTHLKSRAHLLTKTDAKTILTLSKRRNPYLKMLLLWCKKNKKIPVADQVPVGHPGLGIGTMVDYVVYDTESKKYCPIEFKTGFESYLLKSTNQPMRYPFHNQPDHPHNQHHLQVAETYELYKFTMNQLNENNHKIAIGPMYYLNFNSKGIDEYPQPEFINKNNLLAMQQVIANRTS
jgi:hypothetical protein